jgi:hypothetical protein
VAAQDFGGGEAVEDRWGSPEQFAQQREDRQRRGLTMISSRAAGNPLCLASRGAGPQVATVEDVEVPAAYLGLCRLLSCVNSLTAKTDETSRIKGPTWRADNCWYFLSVKNCPTWAPLSWLDRTLSEFDHATTFENATNVPFLKGLFLGGLINAGEHYIRRE